MISYTTGAMPITKNWIVMVLKLQCIFYTILNHCSCLIPGYKARYFVSKPLDRLLFIHIYNKIGRAQGVSTEFASSIVWTKKISYGLQLYNPAY